MPMQMTFRWYGEGNDKISLQDIKQIPGVTGIVWALHDKMSDIMQSFWGKIWFMKIAMKMKKALMGDGKGEKKAMGFDITEGMMQMLGGFTVLRLTSMIGMMNVNFTKEELLKMNKELNRIRKPKKLLKK